MNRVELVSDMLELEEKKERIEKFLKSLRSFYWKYTNISTESQNEDFNSCELVDMEIDRDLFEAYLLQEKKECTLKITEIMARLNS